MRALLDRLGQRIAKLARIPLAGEMHVDFDAMLAHERRHEKRCEAEACGDCARCKPCEPPCEDCDPLAHFRAMTDEDLVNEERERRRLAHVFRDRAGGTNTSRARAAALTTVLAERVLAGGKNAAGEAGGKTEP
jgi:hypothetical protein